MEETVNPIPLNSEGPHLPKPLHIAAAISSKIRQSNRLGTRKDEQVFATVNQIQCSTAHTVIFLKYTSGQVSPWHEILQCFPIYSWRKNKSMLP